MNPRDAIRLLNEMRVQVNANWHTHDAMAQAINTLDKLVSDFERADAGPSETR